MKSPLRPATARLIAAFFAGQAVMLGLVLLLRPIPARARAQGQVVEAEALLIRKGTGQAGIQLSGAGPGGGPSATFFDANGNSRIQMHVDGTTGRPVILLRDKEGHAALGIGLDGEEPAISARNAKGAMVKVPLPKE